MSPQSTVSETKWLVLHIWALLDKKARHTVCPPSASDLRVCGKHFRIQLFQELFILFPPTH